MKSVQLKEERASQMEKLDQTTNLVELEGREMTTDESTIFDETLAKVEALNTQIERAEKLELTKRQIASSMAGASPVAHVEAPKEIQEYRFTDCVTAAYSGKLEGLCREMDQEARLESNGKIVQGIGIPSSVLHQRAVATAEAGVDVGSYVDQLQANSILVQAGANFMSGLVADRKMPVVQSIASSWKSESNTTDVTAAGSFTTAELDPKKLISVVDMSAELMTQNVGGEAAFRKNLAASQIATFEAALLKSTASTTNGPNSIFFPANSLGTGEVTAALIFEAEANLLAAGVNPALANISYLMDASALKVAKGLATENYVAGYMDNFNKTLNTYPFYVSSNVGNGGTGSQLLCGDFSKVYLGLFGGMSILFDPYTKSRAGLGSLIATSLMDGVCAQNGTVMQKIS